MGVSVATCRQAREDAMPDKQTNAQAASAGRKNMSGPAQWALPAR